MKPWGAAGLAVAGLFVAVSLEGQVPGGRRAPSNPVVQMTPAERLDMQINMMATALTLNEVQKRQFRRTLDEARAASVPIQDAISQGRSALIDAIKTGKGQPEIDQVTTRVGGLLARMTALEAKVIAETLAILSPDQIERADQLLQRMPLTMLFQTRSMGNPVMESMGHGVGELAPRGVAPDFNLKRLKSEDRVRLSTFQNRKPVALIFGSYT